MSNKNKIVKNICSAFVARSGEVKSGRALDRDMDGFFHGAATAFHVKGLPEDAAAIAGFIAFDLPLGYGAIVEAANAPPLPEEERVSLGAAVVAAQSATPIAKRAGA